MSDQAERDQLARGFESLSRVAGVAARSGFPFPDPHPERHIGFWQNSKMLCSVCLVKWPCLIASERAKPR